MMLCGSAPFDGNNVDEIYLKIRTGKFKFDRKLILFQILLKIAKD